MRALLLVVLAIVIGTLTGTAPAQATSGSRYYVGKYWCVGVDYDWGRPASAFSKPSRKAARKVNNPSPYQAYEHLEPYRPGYWADKGGSGFAIHIQGKKKARVSFSYGEDWGHGALRRVSQARFSRSCAVA